MTHSDQAPPVPRRLPSDLPIARESRPSARPAWCAAWDLLADREPHERTEVIAAMRAANPISYRTARDVLTQAVADGLLEVVSRDRYGRPTLRRKQ